VPRIQKSEVLMYESESDIPIFSIFLFSWHD